MTAKGCGHGLYDNDFICLACQRQHQQTHDRITKLKEALRLAEEALWMWDYNPPTFGVGHGHGTKEASRGFFCAGCDLDGDEHLRPLDGPHHDVDCRAARAALKAIAIAIE